MSNLFVFTCFELLNWLKLSTIVLKLHEKLHKRNFFGHFDNFGVKLNHIFIKKQHSSLQKVY